MLNYTVASSDYTFNVSVSATCYKSKKEFVEASGKLKYRKQEVTVSSFCELIKEGRSFCHCYDDDDEPFTNSTKTQYNFRYTSYIAFDIDDSPLPMENYLTTLSYQPTIAYTTASNGIKGNRYRLIYCFDSKIKGKEQYVSLFDTMQTECGIGERRVGRHLYTKHGTAHLRQWHVLLSVGLHKLHLHYPDRSIRYAIRHEEESVKADNKERRRERYCMQ